MFGADPHSGNPLSVKRDLWPTTNCHAQSEPAESSVSNSQVTAPMTFPRLGSSHFTPKSLTDAESTSSSPPNVPKEPPASPVTSKPGSRGAETGPFFRQRQPEGIGAVKDTAESPQLTSERTVGASAGLDRSCTDRRGRLMGAVGIGALTRANAMNHSGSNTCRDLDASLTSEKKNFSFKDRQRFGPLNSTPYRVGPIKPDTHLSSTTQIPTARTTTARGESVQFTSTVGKEFGACASGKGRVMSECRSSGVPLNVSRLSAFPRGRSNMRSWTSPLSSLNSSTSYECQRHSERKLQAEGHAQGHSPSLRGSSATPKPAYVQDAYPIHGLPPLQHHHSHYHHLHHQTPLQQRIEVPTCSHSPSVPSQPPRPPRFHASTQSRSDSSLTSNETLCSRESYETLSRPMHGDPPLAPAVQDTGFALTLVDMRSEDGIGESPGASSPRCGAEKTLPPQSSPYGVPSASEAMLACTGTSHSHSTRGSFAAVGRDREKILRRKVSQATGATGITSPRHLDEGPLSCTVNDNFMRQVHGSDVGTGVPPWPTPYPTCETSNNRIYGEATSLAAAIRESRRTSSFSSLYFSMTKRYREMHRAKVNEQANQHILDDDTVREIQGDSRRDELLDIDSGEDSFTGSELQTIGLQETEEHVFIPRYEILQDGQTPMEIMISSIRVAGECRASLCGNQSTSAISAAATAAAIAAAAKSQRMDKIEKPIADADGDQRRWIQGTSADVQDDVFTFGAVSAVYTTDPDEEPDGVDCKIAARLLFDADGGVEIVNAHHEVSKYISKTAIPTAGEAEEDAGDHCSCSMEFVIKDLRGFDYSRYNAHTLYHHCMYCARRPAAFLCLHCLQATCPSHVTRHYTDNKEVCTLFLNQLDITTSYDRVFWCEKCTSFTWRHTEAYDPLVDQIAITRGTYLNEAVRDVSCVGYNVQLKRLLRFSTSSLLPSPQREWCFSSSAVSPMGPTALPMPIMASSLHVPLDPSVKSTSAVAQHDTVRRFTVPASGTSPLITQLLFQRDVASLRGPDALRVGEAVPRLVALGAKVQGWRATQEDAEAAFVVNIPALPVLPQLMPAGAHGTAGRDSIERCDGAKDCAVDNQEEETIPMAVFCVFDGHGGDAVAKLAARLFESHLRKAIAASPYENDARARALLFHLDFESSSPVYSKGESSPVNSRITTNRNLNYNHNRDRISDSCAGPPMLEVYEDEEDAPEILFTEEALRRHVESITMYPTTSDPSPTLPPQPRVVPLSESSALSPHGHTTSPFVSPQEMEMLRVYFASIMEDALLSLDDMLRLSPEGRRGDYQCVGCTACIVGITTNFILCANVGDSGAAYYTPHTIRRISVTHRITDPVEEQRIRAAGYAVSMNRIEGLLAVPRALGDYDFKQCGGKGPREQAVIAVPEVTIMPVPSLLETGRWGVLVACDGVWDSATLHQVHHAIVNTRNDLDVAASASEAVVRAGEMEAIMRCSSAAERPASETAETVEVDPLLLTSAAGIFAQCVAPEDNEEGIGMDNCSVVLIERR